jgi:hypothetical protein
MGKPESSNSRQRQAYQYASHNGSLYFAQAKKEI